jgi:hypothetical protein
MAGNIPLVGFHDLMCVLIHGDVGLIKRSSKDSILIELMTDKLIELNDDFADKIIYAERLKDFDAVIATGSDNSARYFDYYFGKYPHIIRKNRTSVAILTGKEDEIDLQRLGSDVRMCLVISDWDVEMFQSSSFRKDMILLPFLNAGNTSKKLNITISITTIIIIKKP